MIKSPPNKIKGVIFDLDGVIVDTAKYHYLAWKRLAKELGFIFEETDNERLKGVSRMASLDILLEVGKMNFSDDEKIKLAQKKNKWYVEYISFMSSEEILPGVNEFLDELKNAKIKTAIGSASKNTMTILERIKLKDIFDAVVDGNKVNKAKPDPEVFLTSALELGIIPDECIVFEDAAAGIEAAKNGGMRCVGVGSAEILGEADLVISNMKEISLSKLISL